MFKKLSKLLHSEKGEMYISDTTKIVIAIVIGSALLAGLIGITNKVILPATQSWFENMFTGADKYMGSIEDTALDINAKGTIRSFLAMSDSDFYNTYKNDPELGGDVCEIYSSILYGGEYYGIDRRELKGIIEEQMTDYADSHSPREMQFYQDWLDEYNTVIDKSYNQRLDACSSEITHYYVDYEKGRLTEEQFMDKVAGSVERHGFDSEFILSHLF